jgi:hypothetical protein
MAQTPIYLIDYPVSTDLVANGATAMGTISTDVESALQNQIQASSAGYRNQVRNPTYSLAQLPTVTTSVADDWVYFTDSVIGVTNTRNTIGITALLPEWVTGSMTQATASNAAGINRYVALQQGIPQVTLLSGRTVVVSFYARATVGTPKVGANLTQYFGTGGAPSADVVGAGQSVAITTSWARYSLEFNVLSAAGKTVGTNANDVTYLRLWTSAGTTYNTPSGSIGLQTSSIDITGVQVELSYITPLEIRTTERNLDMSTDYGVWQPLTGMAIRQGALDMATTVTGGYVVVGKLCVVAGLLVAGAAGTAASQIQIRPNGIIPAAAMVAGSGMIGAALIDDVGTAQYTALLRYQTATSISFFRDGGTASLTAPTLAIGDGIGFQMAYQIA